MAKVQTAADVLKGIGDAAFGNERNPYLMGGLHTLQIKQVNFIPKREGGNAYIVAFKVIDSTNPEMREGSTFAWYQDFTYPDSAKVAVKAFCYAALGLTSASSLEERQAVDLELVKLVLQSTTDGHEESENCFVGTVIKCESRLKASTKDASKIYTNHYFSPGADASAEVAAE
jgi:hypothetical protein